MQETLAKEFSSKIHSPEAFALLLVRLSGHKNLTNLNKGIVYRSDRPSLSVLELHGQLLGVRLAVVKLNR